MNNVNFEHDYLVVIKTRDDADEYGLNPVTKSFEEYDKAKAFFNEQISRFEAEGYPFIARIIELRNLIKYEWALHE